MEYKPLYLKYKEKYYNLKGGISSETTNFNTIYLNRAISDAHLSANKLINVIDDNHRIITAESITSGLIASVLASIPYKGHIKYGGFIVYDIDAKKRLLGVEVTEENVYTRTCVEQMAYGALNNSNATISIAVSGNSMPHKKNYDKIGEVFIAIAGYNSESNIHIESDVYNFCEDIPEMCNIWKNDTEFGDKRYEYIKTGKNELGIRENMKYAPLQITESLSLYIRYKTVQKSLEMCYSFIKKNNLIVPNFIKNDKLTKNSVSKPNFFTVTNI